jgi:small subunit ribosomal protein S8
MDTIGDFLTKIRNAYRASRPFVEAQASKMREAIARVLKEQGYIEDYQVLEEGRKRFLRVLLRYGPRGQAALRQITRVSKPGRRLICFGCKAPRSRQRPGNCHHLYFPGGHDRQRGSPTRYWR